MNKFISSLFLMIVSCLLSNLSLADEAVRYNIDTSHSSVEFSIRHFVAKTTGDFSQFNGFIDVDIDHPEENYAEATIHIASIDTNSEKRDAHLQEEDYFNSENHPLISFKSTKWVPTEDTNTFLVTGELSMNNVSKDITMTVELLGMGPGMHGRYLSGWEAKTTINRTDWNINGGLGAVGEEVDITINIEAIRE
jgi:polyisoprenoid-binding protein YceI